MTSISPVAGQSPVPSTQKAGQSPAPAVILTRAAAVPYENSVLPRVSMRPETRSRDDTSGVAPGVTGAAEHARRTESNPTPPDRRALEEFALFCSSRLCAVRALMEFG